MPYLGLIIEVALTIAAWLRGWKGWALLPPAGAFLAGFGAAAAGATEEDAWLVVLDLIAMVALIAMIAKGRRKKVETSTKADEDKAEGGGSQAS